MVGRNRIPRGNFIAVLILDPTSTEIRRKLCSDNYATARCVGGEGGGSDGGGGAQGGVGYLDISVEKIPWFDDVRPG